MKYILLLAALTVSCAKDNKADEAKELASLGERDKLYCELSERKYLDLEHTTDSGCDAALFTSLHGLACGYVDPSVFECIEPGKLCRRPNGSCYENDPRPKGEKGSDSGFSKDMATGMQLYYATRSEETGLIARIRAYGNSSGWVVCDSDDLVTKASKCTMSAKIIQRWYDIEKKWSSTNLIEEKELTQKPDFTGHLEVIGILTEYQLYGGISDDSLKAVEAYAAKEPNNLLYQAVAARFVHGNEELVVDKLLRKFPADRLPSSDDWCTEYLYQRDEIRNGQPNKDWLPCPEEGKTHPGTDYLLASWILQLGEQ